MSVNTQYINHSLRATSATRMYSKNVPEKLISEKQYIGHRSITALRVYERTSCVQHRALTKAVNNSEETLLLELLKMRKFIKMIQKLRWPSLSFLPLQDSLKTVCLISNDIISVIQCSINDFCPLYIIVNNRWFNLINN